MALDINLALLVVTTIFLMALIPLFSYAFRTAGTSIFPGSGDPPAMGKILIKAIRTSSEIVFGFFGVIIIALLLANNFITSESGLPIIASIVAYILGKGFKDLSFGEET